VLAASGLRSSFAVVMSTEQVARGKPAMVLTSLAGLTVGAVAALG
jgi:beta-phosphoglucomutase-like phosphatase (HAD superfamily)